MGFTFDLKINNPFAPTTSTASATTPAVMTIPVATPAVAVATPAATTQKTAGTTPPTAPKTATNTLPLVTKQADKNIGLGVETKSTKPEAKTLTAQKKTETMDGFFDRYYTKYKNADTNGKKHFAARYFKSLAKNPAKQAAEFERLRKAGVSEEEIKVLAGTINDLNAKNQFKAAEAVCTKGNKQQNRVGQEVVANNYQTYDKIAQTPTTKMLVKTGDKEIIKMAASHASETDKTNQVEIVKNFQSIDNIDVNKVLIDQYGKYAKENQVGIHTVMSSSKHSETVEYAASNIWHFDKDNQAQAVKITSNTGNEKAINAAAAQYDKYDASARAQIKETINNSGYDSAKTTLSQTEEKAQAELETESKAIDKTTTNEIKDIIKSNASNKDALIKEAFKNNPSQVANWIESLDAIDLGKIIHAIPLGDLPSNVRDKIVKIMEHADNKTQKEFVQEFSDAVGLQLETAGDRIQEIYISNCLKNGKKLPSTNMLSLGAKQNYNEKLKEQNKG